jgi:hypothetical protein
MEAFLLIPLHILAIKNEELVLGLTPYCLLFSLKQSLP